MDDAGVDRAVLVQAVSAYRHDNRYCADAARRFPERFTSVGCVDPSGADAGARMRDLVDGAGMRGVRWMVIREGSLVEPRASWHAIGALGVPAVVTILEDRLPELAEVLPSIADIPVALDHCAFAHYPSGIPAALAALAEFPNLHLKISTNALDSMAEHGDPADVVADLAAIFGAERLMWGSDYSQTHDRPYPELVEWGRAGMKKLSDEQREWALGGTALKLWPELAR
jgi:predicted TIM-barrel fold metal-dependent hydrolase